MNVFEDPVVSISSSQRSWAAELTRFVSDYGGARLRGTVLTVDDAMDQDFEVLIVDDIASYMTPRFVDRIRRLQRKVVGVYDPDMGEESKDRLLAMGVDAVVDAFAGPEEFLQAVLSVRDELPREVEVGTPYAALPQDDPFAPDSSPTVVVGDDNAMNVALAMADSLIGFNRSTVLIDADTVAPSLAQRLGMTVAPNLLTAIDSLVQLRGRPEDSLRRSPRGYAILAGIPSPDEWDTFQPRDVVDLIEHLRQSHADVIVKVNRAIDDLAPIAGRAGRFDVARAVITEAGQVVVATDATPLALTRLLTWIAGARRLTAASLHVVFHNAPRSMYQRGELSEELVRSFVPASITWLPADSRLERAAWNGEAVPPGSYLRAARALTARLLESAGARVAP